MSVLTAPTRGLVARLLLLALRTTPPAVLVIAGAAFVPALIAAARGGRSYSGAAIAASIIAGCGVGFACDDPAAATLGTSPFPLTARRAIKAVMVSATLLVGWAIAIGVAALGPGPTPPLAPLVAELSACAAVSVAFASRVRTSEPASSGAGAAFAAVLVMVGVTAFQTRFPALPSIMGGPHQNRWWGVALVGLACALWASRDPAARRRLGPFALARQRKPVLGTVSRSRND